MFDPHSGLAANSVLWASTLAWMIAQVLKGFTSFRHDRRLDWSKIVGAGGMPSSHSALVTSLATGVGIKDGWNSTVFAAAVGFALVVMYDAAGVRRAAGKQARVLNQIMDILAHSGHIPGTKLRELLGHTPFEVMAGALLGIVVAALMVRG